MRALMRIDAAFAKFFEFYEAEKPEKRFRIPYRVGHLVEIE